MTPDPKYFKPLWGRIAYDPVLKVCVLIVKSGG